MGRRPSDKLLEAVELIQAGQTPQDLEAAGYPHALAYRANNLVKFGNLPIHKSPSAMIDTPPGDNGKKLVFSPSPKKTDKTIYPGGITGQVGGVSDYVSSVPTIIRMPYPEFLAKARVVAQRELGWPVDKMSLSDFLDTVMYYFFRSQGFLLDAYYKIEDLKELAKIYHVDSETGEMNALAREVPNGSVSRPQCAPTAGGQGQQGSGADNTVGEGSNPQGEPGGSKV